MKTPIYNHTSADSAIVNSDYPYGFKLRTTIRFWLEKDNKKGFRFCSQTINPKTGYWNKEKKSTYMRFAASLYLNDKGHVEWEGLSEYSSPAAILAFVEFYPQADYSLLTPFVVAKLAFEKAVLASGKHVFSFNGGEKRELTDLDKEQAAKDIHALEQALVILKKH